MGLLFITNIRDTELSGDVVLLNSLHAWQEIETPVALVYNMSYRDVREVAYNLGERLYCLKRP